MNKRSKWKKLAAMICAAVMAISMLPAAVAAETESAVSSNRNRQSYSTWSSPVRSYLYENPSGGLTRVEYISEQIVVEDYNSSFQLQSSRTIPLELSLWGGFFAGTDYNFLIFGQANRQEDDRKEVIRVVKYDKDWNRIGQASLNGANTTVPFDAGSLRCDEYNGYLYIRTCHEMYALSDGINHQANLTMAVRQSDMTITDSYCEILNNAYGYVSHSFNQFILVDEDGRIVALDHGDAHPRGVAFTKYYADAGTGTFTGGWDAWCSYGSLIDFIGATGDNATGASVGGLAETTDCYIMAYNYDGQGGRGERYPYFHWMDKATGISWSARLTQTPGSSTPVLAPTGLDGGYMLWTGAARADDYDTLYYLHYGADGQPGETWTAAGALSDCQPIYYNGKVVWYVTNYSHPIFYTLDESGVSRFLVDARDQFTDLSDGAFYLEPVVWAVNGGITSGTTETTFAPNATCSRGQVVTFLYRAMGMPSTSAGNPFTDVKTDSYYGDAVLWAYENGITSGTSDTTFGPNAKCTRAQVVTFLWRAMGSPQPVSVSSPFTDVTDPDAYYYNAVLWAVENGITSGTSETTFSPNATCTRSQVVTFLYRTPMD